MKKNFYIMLVAGVLFVSQVFAQEVPEQTIEQTEPVAQEEIIGTPIENISYSETTPEIESIVLKTDEEINVDTVNVVATSTTIASSTSSTPTTVIFDGGDEVLGDDVHIFIRNSATVVFDGNTEVDTENEIIEVTDMNNVTHEVSSQSVLAYLLKADSESDSFDITKLQYFDAYGSFYLKCISVSGTEYCDNWQYLVDGFSPWTGIDQTYVEEGNTIGVYFGNPYQVVFSTSEFFTGIPFTVTAEQYEYQTNTWLPRTGVTIGVTVPDPNNPWSPFELITTPVDINAEASFTIATSGEYMIGVQDDYYYPSYTITVATTTSTSTDSGNSSGGGSSKNKEFDVPAAISFIKKLQAENGSYGGSELYSDWVAVAFAAAGEQDSKLLTYILSKSKIKDMATDNERRVMAILALGKNPYKFNGVNYIQSIVGDFDGTQIGDKSLVNDDIFGILVLGKSGYESSDLEIQKTIQFILSKQNSNGSWENSYDLTAAAVQSLIQFDSVSGVSSSLSKAKNYLKAGQQTDGGWGNAYTTAWVAQAMHDFGENWSKNSKSAQDYFANAQKTDGGVLNSNDEEENRIWATSYVIPAALELSWNDILQEVSKPTTGGNSNSSDTNSTTATSTLEIVVEQNIENSTSTATTTEQVVLLKKEFVAPLSTAQVELTHSTTSTSTAFEQVQNVETEQTPWFKVWWVYMLGGVVLLGIGVKFVLKNK
jgi:hypothetical protein